ncbi:MAG TPA: DJ-1 family glyoxalase III [Chthoniobacteraceae bacterium]|nr:DJ-1 family glyoxalase III [Chthoniobacteraceae bacterium]
MNSKKRVLCLLAPGFEEIEAITPVDLLRRAGVEVTLAAVEDASLVTGRNGLTLKADATLDAILSIRGEALEGYDLLLLPGGPGVENLRRHGAAARLARTFIGSSRPVAAICAAPLVLADAGLLEGRRFTAHFSVHNALPGALGDERVVEEGDLITSRGAGTALDFGLALITRLLGSEAAEEVAASVMA